MCWPWHPHVVHDLAVLASTRYLARYAVSPAHLEDWHRVRLPAFLDRLSQRLGGACLSGHHAARPRDDRDREHIDALTSGPRLDRFNADSRANESVDD